ncbi:hypothetical protein [Actinoplanes sp. NPDC049599]|uniref:hypothetical protein n=1 Tax=Actinoplanes sp. NPDC049599 TaxID=3363903 RepID=UPI00379DA389
MLSHLAFLTRRLDGDAQAAAALAVYAEPSDAGFTHAYAADAGYEGVACVDDAARALVFYCRLWRDYRYPWLVSAVTHLLNFLTRMQQDDGSFPNFILDWRGRPNLTAPSSSPGGPWWTVRAMQALAATLRTFHLEQADRAFQLGRQWLHQQELVGAIALAAQAELDYWLVTQDPTSARFCRKAAEIIADHRDGRVLADDPQTARFWAHHQEEALIRIAAAFGHSSLSDVAITSAFELFGPAVASGFSGRTQTVPYEVSCAVRAFAAVHRASGDPRAAELADLARAWFFGRNAASAPVYDSFRQLTYDGVDGTYVSPNSGAESNIEACFALYPALSWDDLAAASGLVAD